MILRKLHGSLMECLVAAVLLDGNGAGGLYGCHAAFPNARHSGHG